MSRQTMLVLAVIGIILFACYGHLFSAKGYWNLNIPYPAGVTTNPGDITPGQDGRPSNGSGYPYGVYVGNAAGFYGGV